MSSVAVGLTKFGTFADENQFSFVCPIFNAQTKIAACFTLRELVWQGKRPDKRPGCQACMSASKCPIVHIVKRVGDRNYGDPYASTAPKLGHLRKDDLERIERVICDERHLKDFPVSPKERELIASANDRIRKAIGSSRNTSTDDFLEDDVAPITPPAIAKIKTKAADEAALRGDISAAINASV